MLRSLLILSCLFALRAEAFKENVFSDDARSEVTSGDAPWSAIGKLQGPGGSYCTATLIHRDLILTAAHCIMENGALQQGAYNFYPAYKHGYFTQSTVNHFWWGTTDPSNHRDQDWAILRLDTALGDQSGWMGVESMTGPEALTNHDYYMGAYSSDFQGGEVASWESGFVFTRWTSDGSLLHNGDMSRGASGAAIFFYDDKNNPALTNHVVAINVADFRDGKDESLVGIPYSDDHANVAVPSSAFYPTFASIIAQ